MSDPEVQRMASALERIAAVLERYVGTAAATPPVAAVPSPAQAFVAQPAPSAQVPTGICPKHGTPWVWKPGGISTSTGKPYEGFWKCDGKEADGSFCKQRPGKAA